MSKKLSQSCPGFSITIVFGKYGGFNIRYVEDAVGICLGWVAIMCYLFDIEDVAKRALKIKDGAPQ